ncbi:CHL4-domain-containing protein, partial [Nadsonia fulvescens var. elongata DSM 6958]
SLIKDEYIPKQTPSSISKQLFKLSLPSLIKLVYLWLQSSACKPHEHTGNRAAEEKDNTDYIYTIYEHDSFISNKVPKKTIIDRIVSYDWRAGLNFQQLSQLECQLLFDQPHSHSWVCSKFQNANNQDFIPLIEPNFLVQNIHSCFYPMFKAHVHITKHPNLSLIIIRIQFFEGDSHIILNQANPFGKAHWIALPLSSPYIFHKAKSDIFSRLVIQAFEKTFGETEQGFIKVTLLEMLPINSLESLMKFKGASRSTKAMGPWSVYADNLIDDSPLERPKLKSDIYRHKSIISTIATRNLSHTEQIKQLANLRFTGRTHSIEQGSSSRAPLSMAEFKIEGRYQEKQPTVNYTQSNRLPANDKKISKNFSPVFTLRLEGTDIFGGLHELALEAIADSKHLPSYLTGEDGVTAGLVRKGKL